MVEKKTNIKHFYSYSVVLKRNEQGEIFTFDENKIKAPKENWECLKDNSFREVKKKIQENLIKFN